MREQIIAPEQGCCSEETNADRLANGLVLAVFGIAGWLIVAVMLVVTVKNTGEMQALREHNSSLSRIVNELQAKGGRP